MKLAEPKARDLPLEDIAAALDGEASAFRRFYLHYDPTVRWAVGLRVYRWRELVPLYEDIVQEVWTRLVQRDCKVLRYYKYGRDVPFSRFLAFIATRLGWRLAKKHLRHPDVELVEVPDLPEDEALGVMAKMLHDDFVEQLLARARERLDDKDFALLEGYYVKGESIREIAQRLGLHENTAYQRHRRLRKKLADLLEELLELRPRGGADLVAILVATVSLFGDGGLAPGGSSYDDALDQPDPVRDGGAP
jgi:RNA polymerase sigma factor (sigma-70 family)